MNLKSTTPPDSLERLLPLYQQVKQHIVRSFSEKRPGDRLPTEAEYIKQFGVSITTVRQAMRALEQEGWIEKRQGRGTFLLDSSARQHKHAAILLDINLASENLSPFYIKWLYLLQDAFRNEGIPHRPYLGTLPLGTHPSENITCQELLEDLRLDRISAVLGFVVSMNPYWGAPFVQRSIPVLDTGYIRESKLHASMSSIFSHFQQRNRRRIAIIGWESSIDGAHLLRKQISRFAPEYGIEVDDRLIDLNAGGWEQGMGWERFRDIWRSSSQKPDGLLVTDEGLFGDCQKAICELGISIPRDLDVALITSDCHSKPEVEFPVFLWESLLASNAGIYAKAVKALLAGETLPPVEKVHFQTRMLTPETSEAPATLESLIPTA